MSKNSTETVKVVVRVRPMNTNEKAKSNYATFLTKRFFI